MNGREYAHAVAVIIIIFTVIAALAIVGTSIILR